MAKAFSFPETVPSPGDWQTYGDVPPSEVTCPAPRTEHFAVHRVIQVKGRPVGIVRVTVEETIGHFAEWVDMPARDIRRLNGLRYGSALRLNQKSEFSPRACRRFFSPLPGGRHDHLHHPERGQYLEAVASGFQCAALVDQAVQQHHGFKRLDACPQAGHPRSG
jgi:hypothetical protein